MHEGTKAGFTGSQHGMSAAQEASLASSLAHYTELHHGDCIGADAVAHSIAADLDMRIIVHPPSNDSKRAYCRYADEELVPRPYLKRNRDIVDACDHLFATPNTRQEVLRSGTWATIRYARRVEKPMTIIYP